MQCVSFCSTQKKYGCGKKVIFGRGTGTQTRTDVWMADCFYSLSYGIIQVYIIILTHNAQLWKEQLPHVPRQEINRGRVKMLNRNQCHSYSLVHASCPSCKALQDGFSCFSYIMAVWV